MTAKPIRNVALDYKKKVLERAIIYETGYV